MSSYVMSKLRNFSFNEDEIEKTVKTHSIENKSQKRGTDFGSYRVSSQGCRFDYVKEILKEKEILGEIHEVPAEKRCSIVILRSGHLLLEIANCTKSLQKEILRFVQMHFANEYAIEPVKFSDSDLRRMEQDADNLYNLGVYPQGDNEADQIKIIDRQEVRGKDAHEEYSIEPWAKIQIGLPRDYIEKKVSFHEDGTLTIHAKNMRPSAELDIFPVIRDELRPLQGQKEFQETLSAQSPT